MGKPIALGAVLFLLMILAGVGSSGIGWAEEPGTLYGAHGVSPTAVRQEALGNGYFHASIAALAEAVPDSLRAAIVPNPIGGFRVHFFDGPEETVSIEDIEFSRTGGRDRSEGLWVGALMRGYAQHALRLGMAAAVEKSNGIPAETKAKALDWLKQPDSLIAAYDRAIRSAVRQDGTLDQAGLRARLTSELSAGGIPATEAQILIGFLDNSGFRFRLERTVQQDGEVFGAYKSPGMGGVPVRVIEAFMGRAYAGLVTDNDQTMKDLRRFRMGGVAIVAGTWGTGASGAFSKMGWWLPAHGYTLLGYDEAAKTVTLCNPWGVPPDGTFTLPLAVFLDGFASYSYSASPEP
jgi:hypothetical protein